MHRLLVFLNILCTFLVCNSVHAQQFKYRHFTTEDGLPSSKVYSIIQDKRGFIWISTDAGVCRYDGFKFRVFTVKDGLPDNEILNLYEDKQGRIWFFPFKKDLSYFENDSIYKFNPDKFFNGTLLLSMVQDKRGSYWFGTSTKGIFKYENGRSTIYDKNHFLTNNYAYVGEDNNGNIWVSTFFGDNNNGKIWSSIFLSFGILNENGFTKLLKDNLNQNNGVIHPFFASNGNVYGYTSGELFYLLNNTISYSTLDSIIPPHSFLIKIVEDHSGNLLMATSNGALRMSAKDKKIERFLEFPQNSSFGFVNPLFNNDFDSKASVKDFFLP